MKAYIVQKGQHRFRSSRFDMPRIWKDPRVISYRVWFSPSCAYTLPGREGEDWNKGGGVSFDLFTNHTDSVMWSWRYNPATDLMELGLYCHVDGKVVRAKPHGTEVLATVPRGHEIEIRLTIGRNLKAYGMEVGDSGAIIPYTHDKRTARTINAWFGGNLPAPHDMSVHIERKRIG